MKQRLSRIILVACTVFVLSTNLSSQSNRSEPTPSPSLAVAQRPESSAFGFAVSDAALIAQAIVLFGTLLVLIWQTRHADRVSRMAQYLNALHMMSENRAQLMTKGSLINPEQESVFFRQMYALVGKEGYYYKLRLFHTFELFFLLHKSHLIDEDMWHGWRNNMRVCFDTDINREVWLAIRNQDLFHPSFTKFINAFVDHSSVAQRATQTPPPTETHDLISNIAAADRTVRFVSGDTALAALNDDDWTYFLKWLNNDEMVKSMRDLDSLPIGDEDARRYVANHRKDTWLIMAQEGNSWLPIGYIWLIIRQKHGIGRLFIAIGESKYLRHGHAKRASEMLIRWAFNDCNLQALHLSVSANNERAINLYRRQGFIECGRYHDARFERGHRCDEILMELKRQDWIKPAGDATLA